MVVVVFEVPFGSPAVSPVRLVPVGLSLSVVPGGLVRVRILPTLGTNVPPLGVATAVFLSEVGGRLADRLQS